MVEICDIINLIGNLKDGVEAKKFREFIGQSKWSLEQIKSWLDECVEKGKDPYNKAFQDLVVSLGKRLGFKVEYGKYLGKAGERNYDGIWRSYDGKIIVLEVKTSTWPMRSINQLGKYIEELPEENVFGLYVIGKGDAQPLIEQIIGSKYKDKMRIIFYNDLIEIVSLKEKLEPVIGEKQAIEKVQSILFPIESINLGNIVRLIIDIIEIEESIEDEEVEDDRVWAESELISCLKTVTLYQKLLLAALAHMDEFATIKEIVNLMNEIAKKCGIEDNITYKHVRGAKGGIKLRCKNMGKEDIVERKLDSEKRMLKIKERYKQLIVDWVKNEKLWIKQ